MGVLQDLFGGTDNDGKASQSLREAVDEIGKIQSPNLNPVKYGEYTDTGTWTPETYQAPTIDAGQDVAYHPSQAATVGDSAMTGITTDPRLKDSQMAALNALLDVAHSGGMTAADKATLNKIQGDEGAADRGRREAILQNMQARGMGGSGNELLAQLSSGQAATDRANQEGLGVAGMAQQRALDAMMQSGQLSGQMRGQDFGEQSDIAKAQDAIKQFNAGLTTQNSQFNAGQEVQNGQFNRDIGLRGSAIQGGMQADARKFGAEAGNTAKAYGAQNTQGVSNLNTGISNLNKDQPNAIKQQTFGNDTTLGGLKAGALGNRAAGYTAAGDRDAATTSGVLGSLIGAGAAVYGAPKASSDKSVKKDIAGISDGEIDEFLSSVQPKKYKYKSPEKQGQSEGERLGFVAQDVKNTKLGKDLISEDNEGTLQYDKDNLQGIMLAALSKLAKEKE